MIPMRLMPHIKTGTKLLHVLAILFSLCMVLEAKGPLDRYRFAIFQRGEPFQVKLRIQGSITMSLNGHEVKANRKGRDAMATFPAMEAGGPYTLSVNDGKNTHTTDDIYIGDIWVCVGQSNMVFPMTKMHKDATWKPAEKDSYPLVRMAGRNG